MPRPGNPDWKPGVSGNPKGKEPGTISRVNKRIKELMTGELDPVVISITDCAKKGDMVAAKIILDRISPPPRGRLIKLGLPPVHTVDDIMKALNQIVDVMSRGIISAQEAQSAAGILEIHRKAIETLDLERRMSEIEKQLKLSERAL